MGFISYSQFHNNELPSSTTDEQTPTLMALKYLRAEYEPESQILGSYIKWGINIIKDVVSLEFFTALNESNIDTINKNALKLVKPILMKVNWQLIDEIFKEAETKYLSYLNLTGEQTKLGEYLDGLNYIVNEKFENVKKPGELYDLIINA